MSALGLMKKGLSNIRHPKAGTPDGIPGALMEIGVGYGASYALGQAHIEFRDSDNFAAKNLPEIVAGVGKIGGLLLGGGWASSVCNTVGQSGVNSMGMRKGIEHALERTKRQVAITPPGVSFDVAKLPPGTKPSTVLGGGGTHIGAIPQVANGSRWLDRDQIDQIAAMR